MCCACTEIFWSYIESNYVFLLGWLITHNSIFTWHNPSYSSEYLALTCLAFTGTIKVRKVMKFTLSNTHENGQTIRTFLSELASSPGGACCLRFSRQVAKYEIILYFIPTQIIFHLNAVIQTGQKVWNELWIVLILAKKFLDSKERRVTAR